MHLIVHFSRLPTEIQYRILQNLETNDRLNFIHSSPIIELTIARDIDWFIGLLVPLSARNVALATIHAPKRGAREHIRQFRTRVEAFLAEYHAGLFASKLPNPFVSSTGQGRKHLHPKQLGRFRDLLGLAKAIDLLLRDFVRKERASKLLARQRHGLLFRLQNVREDAIFAPSVLDTGSSNAREEDNPFLQGVGFSMTEDAYFFHDERFQANIHASFYRLELFRRVFYSNPMNPLFASGDATPFQTASPENCLTALDAHIHGLTTQWNPSRRASLWDAEFDKICSSVTALRLASQPSAPPGRRQVTKEELDMVSRISEMRAENRRTYTAFEILWAQYALWINNELEDFKNEVLNQAQNLARAERSLSSDCEHFPASSLYRPRHLELLARLPMLSSAVDYVRERASITHTGTNCFRVGPDYNFSQHNMGLVLPEKGRRSGELDDEATVWPVMFRFVTFLASLGLPFLNRCVAMDAKQRRGMLGSIFLYLGRIPSHRIPHFVVGEISGDPFFGDLREVPYLDAPAERSLHPTQTRQRVPADTLVKLSGHLANVLNLPKWDELDKCVVTKEAWEGILDKFATDTVERSELPFNVSDSLWKTMAKAQDARGLRTGPGDGCSSDEYAAFHKWMAKERSDGRYHEVFRRMTTRDSRAKVQFTGVQKRMREVGGLGIYD